MSILQCVKSISSVVNAMAYSPQLLEPLSWCCTQGILTSMTVCDLTDLLFKSTGQQEWRPIHTAIIHISNIRSWTAESSHPLVSWRYVCTFVRVIEDLSMGKVFAHPHTESILCANSVVDSRPSTLGNFFWSRSWAAFMSLSCNILPFL